LRYRKGGTGFLRKCYEHKIREDHTAQLGVCPRCGSVFGRPAIIKQLPALKIVGGKVYWR